MKKSERPYKTFIKQLAEDTGYPPDANVRQEQMEGYCHDVLSKLHPMNEIIPCQGFSQACKFCRCFPSLIPADLRFGI